MEQNADQAEHRQAVRARRIHIRTLQNRVGNNQEKKIYPLLILADVLGMCLVNTLS